MKITKVEARRYSGDAEAAYVVEIVIVSVHTEKDIVGTGFASAPPGAGVLFQQIIENVLAPKIVGSDPQLTSDLWDRMYHEAIPRRGGEGIVRICISALDMALWDIKGKALGVPVYELLGGPTRSRVRVYAHASTPEAIRARSKEGFTAFKTGVFKHRPARIIETPGFVKRVAKRFEELREAAGDERDIGIDFHGAISPQTAKLLIKALEPYQPMFIEEPVQCQNVDVMADIARGTHLPIATGERVFTKWGFRELLEKGAATILQPDLCHAGGITEVRLIAGMAESYYAAVAPHNPLGPISLAAGLQIAGSIPNFLCQEQVHLGQGYIKQPFEVRDGYIDLPGGPGLGVELDEEALKEKIGHDWRNPQPYDADDGSVVDW